jgi:DNA mismatch endonuclease (patch repair protein)
VRVDMDVHTPEKRSYNMSQIKSCDTKPEELVRKFLFAQGLRYRKNDKRYPGKPDIVLPKYRTVIFVNGCFWHKHNCKYSVMPKSNTDFWVAKINSNYKRDIRINEQLNLLNWRVIVVWECELKKNKREETLSTLLNKIKEAT